MQKMYPYLPLEQSHLLFRQLSPLTDWHSEVSVQLAFIVFLTKHLADAPEYESQ